MIFWGFAFLVFRGFGVLGFWGFGVLGARGGVGVWHSGGGVKGAGGKGGVCVYVAVVFVVLYAGVRAADGAGPAKRLII